MDYSGAGAIEGQAVNATQAATSSAPATTVASTTTLLTQPSTTTTTSNPASTTAGSSDPATTTNAPTGTTTSDNTNPSPTTTNPSSTVPKPSDQETSSSSTMVTTSASKSYVRTLSEITSSSAVPIVAVTSSGSSRYTYTSTSYSIFSTSVPTMIEANQLSSPSSVSSGAIAGIVVGCVAFVGLLGALGFFMLRKKNKKDLDISRDPDPLTATYNPYPDHSPSMTSRPFVPAYDPSKQEYGHYHYEPQSAYPQPSEPMMGYEAQSSYPVYDAQPYPPSETLVSYDQTHPPETILRNVPDEKDYDPHRISRHVPDEK